MQARAIVIHSLHHARAAVSAAAEAGAPVTLMSGTGAGSYAGAAWFREVVAAATVEHPEVPVEAVLDCGDAAGHALAALRAGVKAIRYTGPPETARRVADIAEQSGAVLIQDECEVLDLLRVADPDAACRDWIAGHEVTGS